MKIIDRPSDTQTAALKRIGGSPDGMFIKQYLRDSLLKSDKGNRTLSDIPLYRSQGISLTLEAILDLLEAK